MQDKREKEWFDVENALVDREDIGIYEKMLYVILARYANNNAECYPARETLLRKLGLKDPRTLTKYTKTLEEKGLITVKKQKGKSNRYYLNNIKKVVTSHAENNTKVVTSDVGTFDSSSDISCKKVVTSDVTLKRTIKKISIYLSRVSEILGIPLNQVEQRVNVVDLKDFNLETVLSEIEKSSFLKGKVPASTGRFVSINHFIKPDFILNIQSKQYRDKPVGDNKNVFHSKKTEFDPNKGIIQPGELESKGWTEEEQVLFDLGIIDKNGNAIDA